MRDPPGEALKASAPSQNPTSASYLPPPLRIRRFQDFQKIDVCQRLPAQLAENLADPADRIVLGGKYFFPATAGATT